MKKFYLKNRRYILFPVLIVTLMFFWNTVGLQSVFAKRHSVNNFFQHFSAPKVLGYFKDRFEEIRQPKKYDKHHQEEFVADGLTCNFDGSAIFTVTNMLPGDNETKQVELENTGSVPVVVAIKAVRTGPVGETDPLFETILDFDILEGATSVYSNKLQDLFDQSVADLNGARLALLNPRDIVTYDLKVDFPYSANNDYQNKSVVFNLICDKLTADHIVINEVFYNVDNDHGIDGWKDRGSQKNDRKKGQSDEWVELYNPTDKDVSLKNWTLSGNSGKEFVIHSNSIIKAGGFALLAKDASMWKYWDENPDAVKIQSDKFLGDGLDNVGDHLVLRDGAENEVDFVRWGNDNINDFSWTTDISNPSADKGFSIERLAPGFDNDLSSDWIVEVDHQPTP